MSRTLQQHIDDDLDELDNPNISSQRRRHIENELQSLQKYQRNHPNETCDPSHLDLYCDDNPNALECRIYD